MNPRLILLIAVAAIAVLAVVLLTRSYLSGVEQSSVAQPAQKPEVRVFVAARDLAIGTILKPEDYKTQPWPKVAMNESYYRSGQDPNELAGKVVRSSIMTGEPMNKKSLVAPGERGFMAAILKEGMRAVTIALNPSSGVGGFIFPGDRVDVILTHTLGKGDGGKLTLAETVLVNVRVLGVDQNSNNVQSNAKIRKTATLEVTPKMAEKVAMLGRLGSLSLSLRSLATSNPDMESQPLGVTVSRTSASEISSFLPSVEQERGDDATKVRLRKGAGVRTVKVKAEEPEASSEEASQ